MSVFSPVLRFLAILALAVHGFSPAQAAAKDSPAPRPPSAEEAPIALLIDISSGQVLHARSADRRFVPASITKTMTAFLAFELIAQDRLALDQTMTMRPDSWSEWSGKGSTMFLPADAELSVEQLLRGIMTVSANDASIMLAEGHSGSVEAWVAAMNAKARDIGMTASHFGTPNGWPDEGRTFTTANDLAILAEALIERHPRNFSRYIGLRELTYNGITQTNRDPITGRVAGADGIKTGFTNESGFGFLGTASRGGQRLVLVLAGVERGSLRGRLARDYLEWGFSAFDRKRLFAADSVVGEAKVQGGSSRSLALLTDREIIVNVPKGRETELSVRISYDGPLRAPIAAGDRVAMLEVTVPGMEPAQIPLRARDSVQQAGLFDRIFNGIAGWIS